MKQFEQGQHIGYCVVTEADLPLDIFGNIPPGSKPIVWESPVYQYESEALERCNQLNGRYGRAIVCKITFHCEVL